MKSCGHEIVAGAEDFIFSRLVKCLLTTISTYSVSELEFLPRQWSPTFWHMDWFHGRQFFHGQEAGGWMVQVVILEIGSTGKQQMKLHSLTCHSSPAV